MTAPRVIVAIPARDESDYVQRALEALAGQVGLDGRPLEGGLFDIVVFANNCRDDTAAAVRRFAAQVPHIATQVVEGELPALASHVGMARRLVLDRCAQRFLDCGRSGGILASTDADTIVAPDWIAWTLREIATVDAVAGFVEIEPLEQQRLLAPVRLLYLREQAYRRALAELEAVIDPLPDDPAPRHGSFVGASFAVTARAYLAAGRLPALPALEDLEFFYALRRIDARVRHSMRVRAATSARRRARVDGGFGSFMATLHERADHGQSHAVVHALQTLEEVTARAALRRLWCGGKEPSDVACVSALVGLPAPRWQALVEWRAPFGAAWERVLMLAARRRRVYPSQPVEEAIDALRSASASLTAAIPTRTRAASGAG